MFHYPIRYNLLTNYKDTFLINSIYKAKCLSMEIRNITMYKLIQVLVIFFVSNSCVSASIESSVVFKWKYLNFTFESPQQYEEYTNGGKYIPENNFLTGLQTYKNQFYLTLPRFRTGTPVTLATMAQNALSENPLLTPYPDWSSNVGEDCSTFQNIRAMEIDNNGIMWALDGIRVENIPNNNCPQKLVLLDLNNNGKVVNTYTFPEEISSKKNGYLCEIAIDGDYAFISESSNDNPGLIVYSKTENKAWKLFDEVSMKPQIGAPKFTVNGDDVKLKIAAAIFGISLSPASLPDTERFVYYTTVDDYPIYSIPLTILKNKSNFENSDKWKQSISYVGAKFGVPTNDITLDNKNTLWFTSVGSHGLGKIQNGVTEVVYKNEDSFAWPEAFSFDENGEMFVTSNKYTYKIIDPSQEVPKSEYSYFVTKFNTDSCSYIDKQ